MSSQDALDGFEAGTTVGVEGDPGGRRGSVNEIHHGLEELQERLGLADTATDDDGIPRVARDCLPDQFQGRFVEWHEKLLDEITRRFDAVETIRETAFDRFDLDTGQSARIKTDNQHTSGGHLDRIGRRCPRPVTVRGPWATCRALPANGNNEDVPSGRVRDGGVGVWEVASWARRELGRVRGERG